MLYNYGREESIKVLLRIEMKQSNKIDECADGKLMQGDFANEIKALNHSCISIQRKRIKK